MMFENPACLGQAKLEVGQVKYGSHLPEWASKISPQKHKIPIICAMGRYLSSGAGKIWQRLAWRAGGLKPLMLSPDG